MDATLFHCSNGFHLPSLSALSKRKLPTSLFNKKEVLYGPSLFASRSSCHFTAVQTARADGDRRGRRLQKNSTPAKTPKRDGKKTPQSSDGKSTSSSNQEEIISLFKRIQSSVAKGDSIRSKKRSAKVSEDQTSANSVLEVLRQSSSQLEGKTADKEGVKSTTRRQSPVKTEQKRDNPSVQSSMSRPPSTFTRRSPIPSPSIPRESAELKSEALPVADDGNESVSQRMRGMKLPELKELAKTRGLKGYSKLKKSELVELLFSS